jgi:hypothetical protein
MMQRLRYYGLAVDMCVIRICVMQQLRYGHLYRNNS